MQMHRSLATLAAAAIGILAFGQKKPLDHSVYDNWKSIASTSLSRDGKWLLYRVVPQIGDATLEVKSTDGTKTFSVPRGAASQFTNDGKYVVTTVVPPYAEARKARLDKVKPEDQPKNSLTILDLSSGSLVTFPKVSSYQLASEDAGWLVYKPEPPKPAAKPEEAKKEEPKAPATKQEPKKPAKKSDHRPGEPIVLRHLASGTEERIEDVVSYRFSDDGKTLVYTLSTKDGANDGLVWYDLPAKKKTVVLNGLGRYPRFVLDKKATQLAFLTDRDDYAAEKPSYSIYTFRPGGKAEVIAKEGTPGIPAGNWIPDRSALRFSESGKRLFFGFAPKPPVEKKDDTPDEDKVVVDVWHWQDPTLQPMQLLQANVERNRTFEAMVTLDTKKVMALESAELPNATVSDQGDGDFALVSTSLPYRILASWDTGYSDYYLLDLKSNARREVLKKTPSSLSLSPEGKYVFGYDEIAKQVVVMDTATLTSRVVSKDLPFPIWDELNDVPSPAGPYGVLWTKDDDRLLVYDRYDLWSLDPSARSKPVCVTNGAGRASETVFRYVNLDPEERAVNPSKPLMLSALNERTIDSGFYTDGFAPSAYPQKVVSGPKRYSPPVKAKDGNTVYFTRQDFVEYPDVWLADNLSLQNPRKVSNANPQQAEYNWGKAEQVTWMSNDGVPLQGILIKPEDFDYGKKYPMITYFYERNIETLHSYRTPSPTASILNPTMAASNGYIVFIPDIPYKEGYPGESAVSAILPGVQSILSRGYVDPKRLAIDGQSWGGYQVAYLITETNLFRCAYAGAPVSDMFSAYGGIRWGSGMVRQFQYERGQSRIGYSPWEKPLRYLENSPLFFLDKVQTPVLIMSNDKDGAVPWYQGIEMFTGLRRLQKPSWLLVYNNEDHNLVERKNRKDLSIRKQQFFDHYLKDAPMPVWMKTGVPATEKGKTLGYEIKKDN